MDSALAPTPELIVAEAREWIGTPVSHKGRSKGIAADCAGLVIEVGISTGAVADPRVDGVEPWWNYGRLPNGAHIRRFLDEFLVPVEGHHQIGDVAFLAWVDRALPMHLAIMAEFEGRETFIHAHGSANPPHVAEMTFAGAWPARCHGFWRYPRIA